MSNKSQTSIFYIRAIRNTVLFFSIWLALFLLFTGIYVVLFLNPSSQVRLSDLSPFSFLFLVAYICLSLIMVVLSFIKILRLKRQKDLYNDYDEDGNEILLESVNRDASYGAFPLDRPLDETENLYYYPNASGVLQKASTLDDFELYDVVQKYKSALYEKYAQNNDTDALEFAGLEHGYCTNLECRRLSRLGLHKEYLSSHEHTTERVPHARIDNKIYGLYKVSLLSEHMQRNIRYLNDRQSVVSERIERGWDNYYVSRPKSVFANDSVCPFCNSRQTLSTPIVKCTNCHQTYTSTMVDFKVIQRNEQYLQCQKSDGNKPFVFWLLMFLLSPFIMLLLCPILITWANKYEWLWFILIPPALLFIISMIQAFRYFIQNADKRQSIKTFNYLKKNPDFHIDELISSLGNKIKALYFAEKTEDVAAFTECNATGILTQFQDVFDCEFGKYSIRDFSSDLSFQFISIEQAVQILRYDSKHVSSETHIIKTDLKKKLGFKVKNDYNMSVCPSCDKDFNRYSAKTCPHCGQAQDYAEYDWIITDVKIVPFRNEKEKKKWFLI